MTDILLASQSPRRKDLFETFGLSFVCEAADIDESPYADEAITPYAERIALAKALKLNQKHPSKLVIGADTVVIIDSQRLLKPVDAKDAKRMLNLLSGKMHEVLTAVAFIKDDTHHQFSVSTKVLFKTLTNEEIERYISSEEPFDKAGAYAIQGIGGQFVAKIEGSYSNVVGLPLFETAQLLQKLGIQTI